MYVRTQVHSRVEKQSKYAGNKNDLLTPQASCIFSENAHDYLTKCSPLVFGTFPQQRGSQHRQKLLTHPADSFTSTSLNCFPAPAEGALETSQPTQ